ncbi:hypothetical protein TWF481_011605 [Arthrobotrys musiformis]|uniref:F-box domain-containing protein n=1 Tax=Arthrobotrys musiformis TaxID=47236 RepID=A0AAV9W074_9PEZI
MDSTTPRILDILPVDIISYLVEQIIDDEESLRALSQTNQALRLIVLPRLRSHTVIIDITNALKGQYVLDPVYRTISDFNHERNFRIPSHVRVLEIRDRCPGTPAQGPRSRHHQQPVDIKEFVDALYAFLGKCIGLRKFLRDGNEHEGLRTTDLVRKVLELPKLKVLCLKIHQDQQWRHNGTPTFEDYECASALSRETGERGLACLSLALPMTLDRPWWEEIWILCREILINNVHTLKHLLCDGPDLEVICDGMAKRSLAEIRLLSLRFRMGFDATRFCKVLGLKHKDKINLADIKDDAVTQLRRLDLLDLNVIRDIYANDNSAAEGLLPCLRTPNMKRAQVFGSGSTTYYENGIVRTVRNQVLGHLRTYRGLQCAEIQRLPSGPWVQDQLKLLARLHGKTLQTIMIPEVSFDLCFQYGTAPWPSDHDFSVLRRLEISQDRMSFFSVDTLWGALKSQKTISEVQITMRHPKSDFTPSPNRRSIGRLNSFPRRILTPMYSTAFYLHNRHNGINTSTYPSQNDELVTSTRVITPQRQTLGASNADQLHINLYLRQMLHTKRLPKELPLFPQPQDNVARPESQNETTAFLTFVSGIPESLKVFQLQYVQTFGGQVVRDEGDVWETVDGEWVHRKMSTDLLPW